MRTKFLFWRQIAYPQYAGLLIFLISLSITSQLIWATEHQRMEEAAMRSAIAGLLAWLTGMAVIRVSWRFVSTSSLALPLRVSDALLPGFLLLFLPFHVRFLCRWQDQCGYFSDIFLLQFLALGTAVFFAAPLYELLNRQYQSLKAASIVRIIGEYKFGFAFLLTLAILLARGWARLAHPEFFAEDGVLYLEGALEDGWSSLLITYTGYLHVIPQLAMLIGYELIPLEHLPRFTVSVWFVVTALVSANFVRDCYQWLVPSTAARWMVCILLALAPGLFEIMGNLTNLHYVMFILVAMILLKNPAADISLLELACVTLTGLSTSLAIGLIPLAIYRVYLKKGRHRGFQDNAVAAAPILWRDWALLLMMCFPLLWSIQDIVLNPTKSAITPLAIDLDLLDLLDGLINVSVIYYLLFPFAGNWTINELLPYISTWFLCLPLIGLVALGLYRIWRRTPARAWFIALWLLAAGAVIAMIFFARPPGFQLVFLTSWDHYAWWMRYNYLTAVPAILLWFMLLRPESIIDLKKTTSVLVLIIFTSGLYHSQYIFSIERYSEREYWKETVGKLKQSLLTGCPWSIEIEVYPVHSFTFKNPSSRESACPPE